MKNSEIINALKSANQFLESENNSTRPLLTVRGAFTLKKNLKVLQDAYDIYVKALDDILAKHNVTIDTITDDDSDVMADVSELLDCETDITVLKISEDMLLEGCKVSDIVALEFMIEMED